MRNVRRIILLFLGLMFTITACAGVRDRIPTPAPQYDLTYPPTSTVLPTFTTSPTSAPTVTPVSLPTSTFTQVPSSTPSVPTSTQVPSPTPTYELYDNDEKPCVLHNDIFFHPGPRSAELDAALAETFPHWSSFRQSLKWREEPASVGEIIKDASFDVGFEMNPAVTLVTVGLVLDWQLPSDGDLLSIADKVADELGTLYYDYAFDKGGVQGRYSEVHNPATYALYAFFDYDQVKLDEWCFVYSKLYNQSPLCSP